MLAEWAVFYLFEWYEPILLKLWIRLGPEIGLLGDRFTKVHAQEESRRYLEFETTAILSADLEDAAAFQRRFGPEVI